MDLAIRKIVNLVPHYKEWGKNFMIFFSKSRERKKTTGAPVFMLFSSSYLLEGNCRLNQLDFDDKMRNRCQGTFLSSFPHSSDELCQTSRSQ